jgi:hypothetical protein
MIQLLGQFLGVTDDCFEDQWNTLKSSRRKTPPLDHHDGEPIKAGCVPITSAWFFL